MLTIRNDVKLTELDITIIETLFSLSAQQFVEVVSDIIDDFSNVQELISSIVTSFIDFEKYLVNSKTRDYQVNENEVLNLIDFVSATTHVVEKIVFKSVSKITVKAS